MAVKVSFDPVNKIIQVIQAPELVDGDWVVDIDVKVDIYSDGKEDWVNSGYLSGFAFPLRSVGGEPLPGSKALGSTFFLDYGWRIRPYEGNHVFKVGGNLYTDTGASPFVTTVGTHNVMIIQTVSSLVDSTIQQLPEIEYASFNGGVSVDLNYSPYSGTDFPIGTPQQPVNNFADALAIADQRGFTTFYVIGDAIVDTGGDYSGMVFQGESFTKSTIVISPDANVYRAEFCNCNLSGTLDGQARVHECRISSLNYISGVIEDCLLDEGTITLGGDEPAYFINCYRGTGNSPVIDLGGDGQSLVVRNFSGALQLQNKTGPEPVYITMIAGSVTIDNTVTNGTIIVAGVGSVINNTPGGVTVNTSNLVNPATVSDSVWDESRGAHLVAGSFGESVSRLFEDVELVRGTVEDDSATVLKFVTSLTETANNFWDRAGFLFLSGQCKGQVRGIKTYNGTSHEMSFETPFSYVPIRGDEFVIISERKFLAPNIDLLPDAIRTELTPELTQISEIFAIHGLNPTYPLFVSSVERTAGGTYIIQMIETTPAGTTVSRTT